VTKNANKKKRDKKVFHIVTPLGTEYTVMRQSPEGKAQEWL
jgi:hypothetical protein